VKKAFLFIFSILIFCLSQTSRLSGQEISIPGQIPELEEQISILVEPLLPGPYETISIRLEAFGTDLTRAFITWKVNGASKKSGRGEQVFELNSGAAGNVQTVDITIQPAGGPSIQKKLVFRPQEVDLLWESRSYTPPFYKGKALPGFMGQSVLVAIPNFKSGRSSLPISNLTYRWKRGGEIMNNESGFMKNSISIKGGVLLRPDEMTVEVSDDSGNKADHITTIEYYQPFATFYENNPLYGVLFNKEITSSTLKNNEITLLTIPYFFESLSGKPSSLTYVWKVNSQESFLFKRDTATFRYADNEEGLSLIDVTVKNGSNFLQEARARASLRLQSTKGRFLF
jgi:hypothetical protein